ncbi:MAG TPA: hypothetical protein VIG04_06300, partial [Gemmatimonadales bacterium]
ALALAAGVSCTSGQVPLGVEVEGEVPPGSGVTAPPDAGAVPVDSAAAPSDSSAAPADSSAVPPDSLPPIPQDTTSLPPQNPWEPGTNVLVCEAQPYASATVEIGRDGGQITVGNHSLKIPERALSHRVVITMEQVEGTANSVRFSPEGLQFERPAVLTLSYKGCPKVKHWNHIVYTDEILNILEPILSLDFSSSSQVKGLIYHFSRYAVAY